MAPPWSLRMGPWAIGAALFGVITGFAFGQIGDDSSRNAAAIVETTTTGSPDDPDAPTTAPPAESSRCVGPPLTDVTFTAVAGIEGAGAGEIATALGLPSAATVAFNDLGPARQDSFRTEVLALADDGPIVLVVQYSEGPFQKRLATDVLTAARDSVVVVVDLNGMPADVPLAAEFPSRSVALEPPSGDTWATSVASIARGQSICTPPGG